MTRAPRRVDPRGAYLLVMSCGLAYYAGQILVQPSYTATRGLTPVSNLVPLDCLGWVWLGCAAVAAAVAVARLLRRCSDRWGFAAATVPPVMWVSAFAWSWIDAGFDGYPSGGLWLALAIGMTIVNINLSGGGPFQTQHGGCSCSTPTPYREP